MINYQSNCSMVGGKGNISSHSLEVLFHFVKPYRAFVR